MGGGRQLSPLRHSADKKGYASVLREALAFYLDHQGEAKYEEGLARITAVAGSVSEEEADQMMETVFEQRASWRPASFDLVHGATT